MKDENGNFADKGRIFESLPEVSREAKTREQIETEKHNQNILHQSEIHKLDVEKYKFAKKVYFYLMIAVVAYIAVVLSISIFSEIDKHIIITMLSTTTANVIGVFMIASKWLFYTKSK